MKASLERNRAFLYAFLLLTLLAAVPVLMRPIDFLVDDAFFYPQVASEIITTGRSTFNQITLTNGYHPLWMLVNVATMGLTRGARWPGLHLLLTFELLLVFTVVIFYSRLTAGLRLDGSLLGLGTLAAVCASSFWGMESHLAQLLLLASMLQMLACLRDRSSSSYLALGAICGLTTLARLDDCFFALSIMGFTAYHEHGRVTLRNLGLCCASFGPTMLLFAALEYGFFGHVMPISGAIKSSFPHVNFSFAHLGSLGLFCLLGAIVGLGLCPLLTPSPLRTVMLATCTGSVLQAFYTTAFTRDDSTHSFWYYASALIPAALVLDVVAAHFLKRSPSGLQAALRACVLLLVAAGSLRSWLKLKGVDVNPFNKQMVRHSSQGDNLRFDEQLAMYMRAHLPKDARVAVVDFPGRLAFLTDAQVFPLDGLIADYGYNHDLVNGGITSYLETHRIGYYLGPVCEAQSACNYSYFVRGKVEIDGQEVEVFSPLYRTSGGAFKLFRKDLLVDVNSAYGTTLGHGHLAMWHISSVLPR